MRNILWIALSVLLLMTVIAMYPHIPTTLAQLQAAVVGGCVGNTTVCRAFNIDANGNLNIVGGGGGGGAVTAADGAIVTLGNTTDDKSTSTNTTPATVVSLLKEISFQGQQTGQSTDTGSVSIVPCSGTTTCAFVVRSTPRFSGYTTNYDFGPTLLPNSSTQVTPTTTLVQYFKCINTAAVAHTVTITNAAAATAADDYSPPAFSIPALSEYYVVPPNGPGVLMVGIKWSADSASVVNCMGTGLQ